MHWVCFLGLFQLALVLVQPNVANAFWPFTTQQSIPLQRFKGYYNGELTAMPSNVQEVPADYSSLGNFNEPYTDADHIPENNQGRDHVEGDQFQQEQQQPIKTGVASGGVSGGDQFAPVNPLKSPARFRVRTQPGVLRTQSQQQFADPFVPSGFGLTPSESVELQNGNKKSSFPWNWIFVSPVNQLHSDQQPIVLEQVPYGTGLTQNVKPTTVKIGQRFRRPFFSIFPSLTRYATTPTRFFSQQEPAQYSSQYFRPVEYSQPSVSLQTRPVEYLQPILNQQTQEYSGQTSVGQPGRTSVNQNYSTKSAPPPPSPVQKATYYTRPVLSSFDSSEPLDYQYQSSGVSQNRRPVVVKESPPLSTQTYQRYSVPSGAYNSNLFGARLSTPESFSTFDTYESAPMPSVLSSSHKTETKPESKSVNQTVTDGIVEQTVSQRSNQTVPTQTIVSSIPDSSQFYNNHNFQQSTIQSPSTGTTGNTGMNNVQSTNSNGHKPNSLLIGY